MKFYCRRCGELSVQVLTPPSGTRSRLCCKDCGFDIGAEVAGKSKEYAGLVGKLILGQEELSAKECRMLRNAVEAP